MAFSMPSEAEDAPAPVLILRGPVLTAAEEQKKWAQEALLAVEEKAAIMHGYMNQQRSLRDVVRAAAQMLDELRTNLLEPQNYYELYMKVFNVMESVVAYLEETYRSGQHTLEAIYEQVQFCGFIVPRLYLLIAAGAVYIKVGQQPALEIARDLMEMCKGVQHPTRGLFLRHFLLTMLKNRLPGDPGRPVNDDDDATRAGGGEGGTVADTANLLVQNFKEMNWLWIRMEAGSYVNRNGGSTNSVSTNALPPVSSQSRAQQQQQHQQQQSSSASHLSNASSATSPNSPRSPVNSQQRSLRAAQRTQQERRAMCVLVGMNLVRLSQLEGITREVYVTTLLPQLLSILVRYCEPLAQQYLFEVLIQVFPDEFHLFTIDKLFDAISRTVHGVDVPSLLRSLMERLCRYAMDVQDGVTDVSSPAEEARLRDLFPALLDRLANMPVSYRAQIKGANVIKRTSAVPPPQPMLLGAYVNTVRHLVTVARTLYGASTKRRTAALANIVDVVAAKFTGAAAAAAEAAAAAATTTTSSSATPPQSNDDDEKSDSRTKRSAETKAAAAAAAAAATPATAKAKKSSSSSSVEFTGISPAAALAASQLLMHIITECCASVEEVLGMEGVETLTACLPFLERREVALAVCEAALRGSTGQPLLPAVSKVAAGVVSPNSSGAALKPVAVVAAPPPRPRPLTALDDVARLFELLNPLLVDQPDTPSDPQLIYKYNPTTEFVDEQHTVCRVLQLLASDEPTVYLKMLTGVRKLLLMGGARRIPLTYPTLIALHRRAALRLHTQYANALKTMAKSTPSPAVDRSATSNNNNNNTEEGDEKEKKTESGEDQTTTAPAPSADLHVDPNTSSANAEAAAEALTTTYNKNIRKCLSHLYSGDGKSVLEVYAVEAPLRALAEYVTCAITADVCGQSETCYTLFAEALTVYDAQADDTADQVTALVSFVNALAQMQAMSEENYEVLAAKVCQFASKLLKKQDQSRLIAVCATVFAKKQLSQENQQRVEECLRRAMKLAGQVLALPQLHLYVQLLNVFLHFYTAKMNYLVSVELVNELIEKINEASEAQRAALAAAAGSDAAAQEKGGKSDEAAAAFASIRLVYRNITKYIRSRQAAEEKWSTIEV